MKIKDLIIKLLEYDQNLEIINYDDEYNYINSAKFKIDILGFNTLKPINKDFPSYIKLFLNYYEN